jgi:multiple antibiotic resistance protein
VLVVVVCWILLVNAERLLRVLGVNGVNALTKVMGFILVCIGVQLNIAGVTDLVKAFAHGTGN